MILSCNVFIVTIIINKGHGDVAYTVQRMKAESA